ncbi:MAG TPA: proline dehydrogenase family protein [Methylomirabilota bacterium]|jgi:RHH-type proline utilization regulon transcriptional repressor/proline dehydrogenase/delta 1-pyrroline-5-carboxylate dehydrogenase|nr:proline dehydrogenase family protein [Methylomirabilota bacterium]
MEARVQAIGRELYDRVAADRRAFYQADRWTAALFEWSLQHEEAKLQLFRFVDVLPALASDRDLVRHLREYFEGRPVPFAALLRGALGVARVGGWLGEKVVGVMLRETVRRLARRFIAGSTPEQARQAALAARHAGQAFTLDVLGEACLSEAEAREYQRRYLELVEHLGAEARRWPAADRLDRAAWGPIPRVNVSVKLSALHPYLDPADPRGSGDAVKARLRPVLRAAQAHDAHIHVDMEDRHLKDLTLAVFTELLDEDAFRSLRNVGIVLQAYLRDTERDARALIDWARRRRTPVTVRLVKGAYWDYETAHARLESWPVPVFEVKSETDAAFERLTRLFLENADAIDLAVGSHNIRSIAHALAAREALGLPQGELELQALYGMADPLVRALTERGERVRIYMPFGELIPGMAYLVRRLLENTSNESFLRRGFVHGEAPETLLAPPAAETGRAPASEPPPASRADDEFVNEPLADFARAEERQRFAAALATVRTRLGERYPLVIGGERVRTADALVSVNPSRPAEVVGTSAAAGRGEIDRAVAAAERAFGGWRDAGATERARVLGRVADGLRARRAELAAWIVYEAGKPWPEADGDVAEAIDFIEYYRRQATDLQAPRRLGHLRGEVNHYFRDPRGVVAVIAPWNFPLAILTGMTSAALATGNTVVMKPAEQTPVIAARLMEVFESGGVPPGVVNYCPGRGDVAGDRLVRHPGVSLVVFTGSQEVGTSIYATAAQHAPGARGLKRVVAEMGGKNAIIVDDDADLDEAVQGVLASAFGYAGQKCSACSRVIVVGRVYDRLLERLGEAARTLPMGPADTPGTIVGPVIDAASLEKILGYVDLGKRLARPVLIREVPAELRAGGGYYAPPAIFADVPPACALAREEIFGPVLSVMPAASFGEALGIAVDVDYGLTGGVFSRSPVHLERARRAFGVGNLYINRAITGAKVGRQPFGGRQLSGIGYQAGGPDYLLQFVETRVVTENTLRRGFASDELV